ncbi:MAG: ParB N-terminal domain-containing protein [FCB group bacterium]|nr:ParB N-terminal domain-containing protein [FCB group bacterium]
MRKIEEIPIENIKIINPRKRDPSKFQKNVDSIERVGLKRPIVVNTRYLESTGKYELVCGQGRIEAYQQLGNDSIPALIVDVDRPQALIMSIAENATRYAPPPIWFASVIKGLKDSGMSLQEIADIVGRSTESVREYLGLVTSGETVLLEALERGQIKLTVALQIAKATDPELQRLLLEGAEQGMIKSEDVGVIRRMLRKRQAFEKKPSDGKKYIRKPGYSIEMLRKEIKRTLEKQDEFVQKSRRAENRLMLLSEEFRRLFRDQAWVELIQNENLTDFPMLKSELLKGLFEYNTVGEASE